MERFLEGELPGMPSDINCSMAIWFAVIIPILLTFSNYCDFHAYICPFIASAAF